MMRTSVVHRRDFSAFLKFEMTLIIAFALRAVTANYGMAIV